MTKGKNQGWPRRLFRYFRITLLGCLLLGAGFLLWFNYVGLPGFIQQPILDELRQHHFDLAFGKIRLHGFRQFVAENISFKGQTEEGETRFHIGKAELLLNSSALRRFDVQLEALDIREGTLAISMGTKSNAVAQAAPSPPFLVQNISSRLELGSRNTWKLDNFRGETMGLEINISGSITNISQLAKAGTEPPGKGGFNIQSFLTQAAVELEKFEFKTPPRLWLQFQGDARTPLYSSGQLTLRSSAAKTGWGSADAFELMVELLPKGTNWLELTVFGYASRIAGRWGELLEARIDGHTLLPLETNALLTSNWTLKGQELGNPQLRAGPMAFSLKSQQIPGTLETKSEVTATLGKTTIGNARIGSIGLTSSLTHPVPPNVWNLFGGQVTNQIDWLQLASTSSTNGQWKMTLANLDWEHSHLDNISISGTVVRDPDVKPSAMGAGFWDYLAPYQIAANLAGTNGRTADLKIRRFSSEAVWRAPLLSLLHLQGELGSGKLTGTAELNVMSRKVEAALQTTFNPADIGPLLSTEANEFMRDIRWSRGPVLDARFGFTLPALGGAQTNEPAFRDVNISGKLAGALSLSGVELPGLNASFHLTNQLLSLPEWSLETDQGTARGSLYADLEKLQFNGELHSGIDPRIARDFVPKEAREPFEMVKFSEGYQLDATFAGTFTNLPMASVEASLAATNFTVREERFSALNTGLRYTNGVISAHQTELWRGKEYLKADMLYFNPARMGIFVTNVVSTMNPWLVMSLAGDEEVYEAIDPYRFDPPPFVKLNGWVPLANPNYADLVFEVNGTNFHYWRFNADAVSGMIHWRTNLLSITNVQAKFYGGHLDWEGHFKFKNDNSADYRFIGIAKDADLKPLMADLVKSISGMEGNLNGKLVVTSANSDDWKSWNGYGEAVLKNGLLWSIPVFGVFSPVLDGISPGLGTSKISEGSGTFQITNSVITTRDMEMRAPAFRLKYAGWVDFDGNVDANVKAQLFRDATLIGKPLSIVLWPVSKVFEGKITGKLENPKRTLRHFDFILGPLRSILSIKDLLPQPGVGEEKNGAGVK